MFKTFIAGLALVGLALALNSGPVRTSGSEQQKKLVTKVTPVYPADAKAKGIEGTVKLEAVINKDGTVKEVKALSGPEELIPSSIEAVRQWVYEPTTVNGKPVEVITDINVNYTLSK
jgi:protein TonB